MEQKALLDPNSRSTKARDRTSSGLAAAIKTVREEDATFSSIRPLIGLEKLHILVVSNNNYKDQGRESNFGTSDYGKPAGVGFPTGGSEAQEATEHAAERETAFESGFPVNHTIRFMEEYTNLKRDRRIGMEKYHPHFLYLIDVDSDYVGPIREKKEIKWAKWITFCEIVERLKLGQKALKLMQENRSNKYNNPEAFYFSHANNFLIPFFLSVYYMTEEEIDEITNNRYRNWIKRFRPYIVQEIDDHAEELIDLRLMDCVTNSEDNGTEETMSDTGESPSENNNFPLEMFCDMFND